VTAKQCEKLSKTAECFISSFFIKFSCRLVASIDASPHRWLSALTTVRLTAARVAPAAA
jgi:hypothetical protein